jgi:hypothetical protein
MSAFAGGRSEAEQQKLKEQFPDEFREFKAEHPGDSFLSPTFGTCFVLDFPDSSQPFGHSACTMSGFKVPVGSPGFNDAPHAEPESAIQAEGMTGASVESIEVSYEDDAGERIDVPVAFGRLSEELAARIDAPNPMGSYVAFLPAGPFPNYDAPALGSLQITGFGADGEVVKQLDYGPIYAKLHERRREVDCVRRKIEPLAQEHRAIPLSEIRRECEQ